MSNTIDRCCTNANIFDPVHRLLKVHFREDMFLSDDASYFQLEYLFCNVCIEVNLTDMECDSRNGPLDP